MSSHKESLESTYISLMYNKEYTKYLKNTRIESVSLYTRSFFLIHLFPFKFYQNGIIRFSLPTLNILKLTYF